MSSIFISNELTGEIPAELGRLTSLQYLGLSFNALTGENSSLRLVRFPTYVGNFTGDK